jgi:hypothetical protein
MLLDKQLEFLVAEIWNANLKNWLLDKWKTFYRGLASLKRAGFRISLHGGEILVARNSVLGSRIWFYHLLEIKARRARSGLPILRSWF